MSRLMTMAMLGLATVLAAWPAASESMEALSTSTPLTKLTRYLAAGDYRRALEACQRNIDDAPSAATYIHLTYVYHTIDAYLEHLSKEDRWMAVEHLYLNLATRGTEDLVDPPGGLARMVKEMIQLSVRQQSDVSAGMANRMDKAESDRLWMEQTKWRVDNPQAWWHGLPSPWIQ